MYMKENLIHSRTCVYNINYHVVWSVKYRRKIITQEIETRIKQESYSSQCPPDSINVSKKYAVKQNRIKRGLYICNGNYVFLISMVPLIELRGAIPYAQAFGLPMLQSYIIAVIGNMIPVPCLGIGQEGYREVL